MRLRWFPWTWMIRRLARAHGFLDPVLLMARLARFGQPSEIAAPTELLRASALLHARGLINSQTIQYNLDWIWPYWVVRQFTPTDTSFIPRAFSLTHINLTHRNWTAIGLPDVDELPIVDPRGLITPWLDGWSVDGWLIPDDGAPLIPAKATTVSQRLALAPDLAVITETSGDGLRLTSTARVVRAAGRPVCRIVWSAAADRPARLIVALRPYNPEGIALVHAIAWDDAAAAWQVDGRLGVAFVQRPEALRFSQFSLGDVFHRLDEAPRRPRVDCPVGLATAAALFTVEPSAPIERTVEIPLGEAGSMAAAPAAGRAPTEIDEWRQALAGSCAVQIPDPAWQFLYEAAVRALVLHAPGELYPGPYTYKRFWFRDAAFMVHALVCAGLPDRAEQAIDRFPHRQTARGYFLSQEGEWDANGEVLWAIGRFCALTGRPPKPAWRDMIERGAQWLRRKRLPSTPPSPHAGLLPPGYSAEHLGPSDYYYWDDFWGVAGLQAAAALMRADHDAATAERFDRDAATWLQDIERSLALAEARLGHPAMPASPYRRMDPGAIGSIAAGYPLQLWAPDDRRLRATVEYLLSSCFVHGGFFQDMSHSGINPYLTLEVAQVLLRAGDARWLALLQAVAGLASPTGQWPEAVHPWTGGGCMGDGQHLWASAEWLLALRQSFVREEGGRLILGSGLPPAWQRPGLTASFGPAPTAHGPLELSITADEAQIVLAWRAHWRGPAPPIEVRLPGHPVTRVPPGQDTLALPRVG